MQKRKVKRWLSMGFALISCVWAQAQVQINETNFPDEKFRTILSTKDFDINQDQVLSPEEISKITSIQIPRDAGVTSLVGIEHFTELTKLFCTDSQINFLDLSNCPKLQSLDCTCPLYALNLHPDAQLTSFNCIPMAPWNKFTITTKNNQFDLSSLPGLDVNRAYDFEGDFYRDGSLFLLKKGASIRYKYKTGVKSGKGEFASLILYSDATDENVTFENVVADRNRYYDADGDGVKELFVCPQGNGYPTPKFGRYRWFPSLEVFALDEVLNLPGGSSHLENYNNDGIPDFTSGYYSASRNGEFNPVSVSLSTGDSTYREMSGVDVTYPLDVNNDGLVDFYSYNRQDKWHVFYQQADGSFVKTQIDTLSRTSAEDLLRIKINASTGEFDLSGLPSLRNGMFVGGQKALDDTYLFTQTVDVNHDGYMDLVGPQTIFYNMDDNHFVAAHQPGEVTVKDLNGDGITDFIYNDKKNQRVYVRVYLGDDKYEEITLAKDLEVSDIHCYDFDKDEDVDILLTFDYKDKFGYSFLVFAENQGNGKFAIHENVLNDHWLFGRCLDIDNDGKMELVAGKYLGEEEGYDEMTGESYYRQFQNLYLFRLDQWNISQPLEEPLIKGDLLSKSIYEEGLDEEENLVLKQYPLLIDDIDNDGNIELRYEAKPNELTYLTSDKVSLLKNTPANQAPAQMAAPKMVVDQHRGCLKVSWLPGKDKETSTVDLTYALRVGSAPGKDDIYFSDANPDGSRRDFRPGNMGANLDIVLDVKKWKSGNYYISIQTVDLMGKGSQWSEEVVYHHDYPVADFSISHKTLGAVDTLVVTANPPVAGFESQWDWNGGQVVKVSPDSAMYWVIFPYPGQKELRHTVRNLENGVEKVYSQKMFINSMSLLTLETELSGTPWDFNNDGALDLITQNGLYVQDGKGNYEKLGSIFNSNFEVINGTADFVDFDMDGDADFFTHSNKGNLILNNGNHQFEGKEHPLLNDFNADESLYYDLNNDGFRDCLIKHSFYKNTGNYVDLEQVDIPSRKFVCDVNRDGYLDFWDDIREYDTESERYNCKDCFNLGGANFEYKEKIGLPISDSYIQAFEDFNSDGYYDKLYTHVSKGEDASIENAIAIYYGKANYTFEEPKLYVFTQEADIRDLTIENCYDHDNNGCPDIEISFHIYKKNRNEHLVLYMERDKSARLEDHGGFNKWQFADIDNDGVPDYGYDGLTKTNIQNTVPLAPTHVRASQEEQGILLEWKDAVDKETPAMQMRYNISVKKKGASGPGAYIISPLNSENNQTAILPENMKSWGKFYQKATRKMIPIERFEAGQEYELRVQAIDSWNAHSPFSETYTFKVSDKFIAGPNEAAPNKAVTLIYNLPEETLQQVVWNWDGGVLESQEGTHFNVVWKQPGLKTVTATLGGETVSKPITVRDINLDFDFPKEGVAQTLMTVQLPKDFVENSAENMKVELSDERVEVYLRPGCTEAQIMFPRSGEYWLRLMVNDDVCGWVASETKEIKVMTAVPEPHVQMISIDATTGKNMITWDAATLPDYTTAVNVYKESVNYGKFDCIGKFEPQTGGAIDYTSEPTVVSSRYYITTDTEMGVESPRSKVHSSIHLMLNKGLGGTVNLVWNLDEGGAVKKYRILRGTNVQQLEMLAEVSGATTAYTDKTAEDGNVYFYALEFDAATSAQSTALKLFNKKQSGYSNVACTDAAWTVTPAENLKVFAMENELVLTPEQPALHFRTEILPVTVDMKNVNWQIVEGSELATISQNGVLSAVGKADGQIIVRATTIDGSGLMVEVTVQKKNFATLPTAVAISVTEGVVELTPTRNSLHLQATVSPANSSQLVRWEIVNGSSLAQIDADGVVTATEEGNGEIVVRAYAVDDESIYGEIILSKTGFATGIQGMLSDDIVLHRKGHELWITGLPTTSDCVFRIVDFSGRILKTEMSMNAGTYRLSLEGLSGGVYLLQIACDTEHKSFRFIVK